MPEQGTNVDAEIFDPNRRDDLNTQITSALLELGSAVRYENTPFILMSSAKLIAYLSGYQTHLEEGLKYVYDDPDEVIEESWNMTWKKLREQMLSQSPEQIATIVGFFDSLVALQYPASFDPSDRTRGREVSSDVSARTFYQLMEPHLPRSSNVNRYW